jgi:hypothetical protein
MNPKSIKTLIEVLHKHRNALSDIDSAVEVLSILKKATKRYDEYSRDDDAQDDNELGDGFSEVDGDEEDDAAAKWLKENSGKKQKPKEVDTASELAPEEQIEDNEEDEGLLPEQEQTARAGFKEWSPREYSANERGSVNGLIAQGYTPREAERLAGLEPKQKDYYSAMRNGVAPSMMSGKMHEHLKPLAREWLDRMQAVDAGAADPAVNPLKHASGQLKAAHDEHYRDFSKEYDKFLSSPEVKDLKGRERHKTVETWKKNWKDSNPEHQQQSAAVSEKQSVFNEAKQASKNRLEEILGHIMSGGHQSAVPTVSEEASLQHLGGGKDEEGKTQGMIQKDPTTNFAANNPKLVQILSEKQKERLNNVNTAQQQQGKTRTVKTKNPSGNT